MPVFLDTRGKSKIAIGICGRCSRKFPYSDLIQDGNNPSLWVCPEDRDDLDPWRLPPHPTEDVSLQHARPDLSLSPGPISIYTRPLQAELGVGAGAGLGVSSGYPPTGIAVAGPVTTIQVSQPWSANAAYSLGATVTERNPVGFLATPNLFNVFVCIVPGISGPSAPTWNEAEGSLVTDNTVTWMNGGIYLEP